MKKLKTIKELLASKSARDLDDATDCAFSPAQDDGGENVVENGGENEAESVIENGAENGVENIVKNGAETCSQTEARDTNCAESNEQGSGEALIESAAATPDGEADSAVGDKGATAVKEDAEAVRRSVKCKGKVSKIKPVSDTNRTEVVRESKETSTIRKLSAIWTLISTAYAIVTTCLFVSRDWVSSTVSYVLIGILSVYILLFVGLIVYVVRDPKKGTKTTKTYKKVLGIFKAFINVVFLALTAVSLTGMAANDMSVGKWIMFVLTFIVAVVQLGLKISLLVMKMITKHIAKTYKVKIENYRDGRRKKKGVRDVLTERKYRDKD